MKRTLIAMAMLVCSLSPADAATWRPPDRLLHAVRYVESAQGRLQYGDNGQSLGDFQMSEAAWLDVSSFRKSRGMRAYDYNRYVFNPQINRIYAADYLALIFAELEKKLRRRPNVSEIYAAYNMGLQSFAECDYQIRRVNPVTAKKCQQIQRIMAGKAP
jgi:hypothetical protein